MTTVSLVEWAGDGPTTPMGGFNILIQRPGQVHAEVQTGPNYYNLGSREEYLPEMRKKLKELGEFYGTKPTESLLNIDERKH